jgi:hypothetical protein
MLQNRVNPNGDLITTKARGAWIGNRGVLHGASKTILRPFKHKAWIICQLQVKGRHRQIMAPNLWTELFFLDEATAFAAGHRPCFECRRDAANSFKAAWLQGNPQYGFDKKTSINKIDDILQAERIGEQGCKIIYQTAVTDLPNGAFICLHNQPYLLFGGHIYLWHPEGYGPVQALPNVSEITVLTPQSIVNAFRAGYTPQMALSV